jgi:hypothetical protein
MGVGYESNAVLRALRWSSSIIAAANSDALDEVARVVGEACRTPDAWLFRVDEPDSFEIAHLAAKQGEPVTATYEQVPDGLSPAFCGASVMLAVPDVRLTPEYVAIVLRPAERPYSRAEVAQVEAILGVHRQVRGLARCEDASGSGHVAWSEMFSS